MDDNQDGSISAWEFYKALKDFRLYLDEKTAQESFIQFAGKKEGQLNIEAFMNRLIGSLPESRMIAVEKVFSLLDPRDLGEISIDNLRQNYSAKHHPDVMKGLKSVDEALGEFIELFDTYRLLKRGLKKQTVSRHELQGFFNYLSPFIPSDEDFKQIVNCCVGNIQNHQLYGNLPV